MRRNNRRTMKRQARKSRGVSRHNKRQSRRHNMKQRRPRRHNSTRKMNKKGGFMKSLKNLRSQVNKTAKNVMSNPRVAAAKQAVAPQLNKMKTQMQVANRNVQQAVQKGMESKMGQQAAQKAKQAAANVQKSMKEIARNPNVQGVKTAVASNVNKLQTATKNLQKNM